MINKNSKTLHGMFIGALLCSTGSAIAEIHQGNAFLYGDNIEVGLGPDGAFGSDVISPDENRKAFGKRLGYISDPTGLKFTTDYHGDFFLPGFPEEGWGIRFDDKIYNNNSNQQGSEIIGSLSNFNATESSQSVVWEGEVEGLEITQVFRVYTLGTAIVFDVTLKNTTATAMQNVYYMRTVDPDNNAEQDPVNSASKYKTTNTIISQGSDKGGFSAVSSMQDARSGEGFSFTKSLLTLNGYGKNSRAIHGGLFNRDPKEVFEGSDALKQTGSLHEDEAISLAFKFDQIGAGDTVTFRAGYQLKDVPSADLDIDSSDATGNEFTQLYLIGHEPVKITDSDTAIEGIGFSKVQEALITITNTHSGDVLDILGTLPDGITLDTVVSGETKIRLTGLASKEAYQTALTQIQFKNDDPLTNIETRRITVQIIDDNATPSNTAISIIKITIPVSLDDEKITGDDVVNASEAGNVGIKGKAAPNSTIILDFTDKNGKKLSPPITVTTDENGNWNLDNHPADISSLSDGPITILVTATDPNGNVTTFTKEFIKDTIIILMNITPVDNQLVSSLSPVYKGKTDPNASVTLKILPDGKVYTTTADENGNWSIPLDRFPLDTTTSVKITAVDDYANEATTTVTFKTPNLPLDVTDLDVNNQGVATSTTPTIKGTSDPNTTITIHMPTANGQNTNCTTATDSSGNWSCKMPPSHSGGPYTLTVTTTDANGSTNSTTRQITIPDLSLTIDSPTDNELVGSTTPTFKGKTSPNTDITLTVLPDGKTYTTTADEDGNWTVPLDELPKGKTISVEVTASDPAGNETTLIQKIQTPSLPILLTDADANDQGVAHSTTPTLQGTSEPNTTITINMPTTNGQVTSCTTITDADGNWTCKLPISPSGGPYTVTITTTDSDGNTNSTTKDLTIPELPLIIDNPADNAVISSITPEISGTSKPGTNVTVLVSNGEKCTAVTDATNHWTCQLPTLDFDSNYTLTVTTEDGIGNQTTKTVSVSTNKLPLSIISPQDNTTAEDTTPTFVGTTAPKATVIVTFASGQTCTTKADSDGNWSCEVPALPVGGPYDVTIQAVDLDGNNTSINESIKIPAIPLVIISPTNGEVITSTGITVTGNSDPNTSIKVLGPDGESCETISDASGAWSCPLDNLQSGDGKNITVISGEDTGDKKVTITTVDIKNSSKGVKTVLAGSSSSLMLFLLSMLLISRRMFGKFSRKS